MTAMKLGISPLVMKNSKSIVSSLPRDMLVEIAMQVVSNSSTPIDDVKSLRATCKGFYKASKDKLVGRSISVSNEYSKMYWREKDAYLALLRNCADSGNLDASFIIGLDEIYNSGRMTSGMRRLKKAMSGGHFAAAYMIGVLSFFDAVTRPYAMEILNKVSCGGDFSCAGHEVTKCTRSGNAIIDRCRREAMEITKKSWTSTRLRMEPRVPCGDRLCGRVVKAKSTDCWVDDDRLPKAFCSHVCRWMDECYKFFEN